VLTLLRLRAATCPRGWPQVGGHSSRGAAHALRNPALRAPGGAEVQSNWVAYNWIDTVVQRTWNAPNGTLVTENFTYDALNRLVGSSLNGAPTKTNTYDAAGTHRLASISGTVNGVANPGFTYDANGNITQGATFSATWTSFNMPAVLGRPGKSDSFVYGPEHQRIRQTATLTNASGAANTGTSAGTLTTYYAGSFEKEVNSATGITEYKSYISAGGRMVAVLIDRSNATTSWRYFHQDHLGSTVAVTSETGAVVERLAYDAWGRRANADGTDNAGLLVAQNDRGYTGHEMLDSLGLIHMNGRIYDPLLARFFSADPFIQAPGNLQSYNRYSYVINNPMNLTDPSGYSWFSKHGNRLLSKALRYGGLYFESKLQERYGVRAYENPYGRMVGAAVAAYFTGGLAGYWLAGAGYGATAVAVGSGAVGGFTGGLLASGGDLKAAAQGALTGGAFGFVGGFAEPVANYAGHAAIGCASGAAGGGGSEGCARGAASQVFSKFVSNNTGGLDRISRGVVATMAGGTASLITGGKFGSGAMTAAMGYLFNELMSHSYIDARERQRLAGYRMTTYSDLGVCPAGSNQCYGGSFDGEPYQMPTVDKIKMIGLAADAATFAAPPLAPVLQPVSAGADISVAVINRDGKGLIPLVTSEAAGFAFKWLDRGINASKFAITRLQVLVNQSMQAAPPPERSP
jgi:RHS repeat-associated protein